MKRIRSPGYPSCSLVEAIEYTYKIHAQDRQHPVDRLIAAQHLGFSGISGASDRALSALIHYGLAEKVHKGEIRVSDRALAIIHPHSPEEQREALRTSGFAPDLFKELRQRYPGPPPSKEALSSFLSREGFGAAAIGPASKAYLETCHYLQREKAYESDSFSDGSEMESQIDGEKQQIHADNRDSRGELPVTKMAPAGEGLSSKRELVLNQIYMNVKGNKEVHIEGILDYRGLLLLEKKLIALKMLLEPNESEEDDKAMED